MTPNTKSVCRIILFFGLSLLAIATASGAPVSSITPTRLQCDYRTEPLGIDSARPRMEWVLQATDPQARGLVQTAYQILAASTPELLAKDRGDL